MTIKPTQSLAFGAALFGVLLATAADAHADRRVNTLPEDVAVRHRKLLVKNRLEVTPLFESTISADFKHTVGGGLKLEYHLGDMLSIGGLAVGSKSFNTKLVDRIVPTLEMNPDDATREPSREEFLSRLNENPLRAAAYISLTPWYGKLAAFGQAFVAFDFYFQAGLSYAQLTSNCRTSICNDPAPGRASPSRPGGTPDMPAPPDNNPNNDPPLNSGSRLGLYLGAGIHVFLNDFIALDLTVRDYAFSDNPSGADYNADLFVGRNEATGEDDNRFLHHLYFGAGISIMFPTKVKRTP
jgi:outer membrane beta-barrel protein